jgi:hypothetical protein
VYWCGICGIVLPIVARPDLVIIDGFHRWTVSGREALRSMLATPSGAIMVPVVIVNHDDPSKNIYGTITHNRARRVHQLGPMKAIVKQLLGVPQGLAGVARHQRAEPRHAASRGRWLCSN